MICEDQTLDCQGDLNIFTSVTIRCNNSKTNDWIFMGFCSDVTKVYCKLKNTIFYIKRQNCCHGYQVKQLHSYDSNSS